MKEMNKQFILVPQPKRVGDKAPNWKGDDIITKRATRKRARRICGNPEGKDVHHKDGNEFNNEPSNLEPVTRSKHMREDGRLNKLQENHKKSKTNFIEILSSPEVRAKAVATRRKNGLMPLHHETGELKGKFRSRLIPCSDMSTYKIEDCKICKHPCEQPDHGVSAGEE